jgi:hypothetical protein
LIHRAAEILAPLYDRMLARIVANAHCQADETSFRLQNRPDKRGFVWTFLASKLVAYVFSGDRSGMTPSRLLEGTAGSLFVDAYTGSLRRGISMRWSSIRMPARSSPS